MKKIVWIYIRFVQKILINILLTITYIVFFPLTWFVYRFFIREKLYGKFIKKSSYWKPETILNDDIDFYTNQS